MTFLSGCGGKRRVFGLHDIRGGDLSVKWVTLLECGGVCRVIRIASGCNLLKPKMRERAGSKACERCQAAVLQELPALHSNDLHRVFKEYFNEYC